MSIFNRRNAALGWLALVFGKRVVKRKAKAAARVVDSEARRPKNKAFALVVAAAVGGAAFFRRRTDKNTPSPS
jgi:hypothetical protein